MRMCKNMYQLGFDEKIEELEELQFEKYIFHEPILKDESFSLLIYDIVDNSKRLRFAKFMESYGKRVQKSAFEIRIEKKKHQEMLAEIPSFVSNEDSIKLYRIRGNGEVYCWGNAKPEISDEVLII